MSQFPLADPDVGGAIVLM